MKLHKGRRHLRVAFLRCLHILRRHHLSMVSAAVLVTALTAALTSSSFDATGGDETGAVEAAASRAPDPPSGMAPPSPTRVVVYYIVDTVEQIDVLRATLRGDTVYLIQQGLPPMPPVATYYLLFDSPEEEALGARFLSQVAESAPYEGYTLQIVDLTR